jgi:hypothetical protein
MSFIPSGFGTSSCICVQRLAGDTFARLFSAIRWDLKHGFVQTISLMDGLLCNASGRNAITFFQREELLDKL